MVVLLFVPVLSQEDIGDPTDIYGCKKYYPIVVAANRYYNYGDINDTAALMAQAAQESSCNPYAKSPYADGFFQFIPTTANWIGKLKECDLGEIIAPYNVKWSIYSGVCYMKILKRGNTNFTPYCEQYAGALSNYNGGKKYTAQKQTNCLKDLNCDYTKWFDNVELQPTTRSASNEKQNRDYVQKILLKLTPKFIEAGYIGENICKDIK